jgi:hypothetical protein
MKNKDKELPDGKQQPRTFQDTQADRMLHLDRVRGKNEQIWGYNDERPFPRTCEIHGTFSLQIRAFGGNLYLNFLNKRKRTREGRRRGCVDGRQE